MTYNKIQAVSAPTLMHSKMHRVKAQTMRIAQGKTHPVCSILPVIYETIFYIAMYWHSKKTHGLDV
jgi:hypothetical protein